MAKAALNSRRVLGNWIRVIDGRNPGHVFLTICTDGQMEEYAVAPIHDFVELADCLLGRWALGVAGKGGIKELNRADLESLIKRAVKESRDEAWFQSPPPESPDRCAVLFSDHHIVQNRFDFLKWAGLELPQLPRYDESLFSTVAWFDREGRRTQDATEASRVLTESLETCVQSNQAPIAKWMRAIGLKGCLVACLASQESYDESMVQAAVGIAASRLQEGLGIAESHEVKGVAVLISDGKSPAACERWLRDWAEVIYGGRMAGERPQPPINPKSLARQAESLAGVVMKREIPDEVLELHKIIVAGQSAHFADSIQKQNFVDSVNRALEVTGFRIRLPSGVLARLKLLPGRKKGKEIIGFSEIGRGPKGKFRTVKIELVPYQWGDAAAQLKRK